MILACHSIFGAYGFWLPNDPRGSWSDAVCSWELYRFGPASKTSQRRSLAWDEHDHELRLRAKEALKYLPVQFTGRQAKAVGDGFAIAANEAKYQVLACSILPKHVHMVVTRSDRKTESIVHHMKSRATKELNLRGIHPFAAHAANGQAPPTAWARGGWNVYLNSPEAVAKAISYVEENPVEEGKPRQRWSFVAESPWGGGSLRAQERTATTEEARGAGTAAKREMRAGKEFG